MFEAAIAQYRALGYARLGSVLDAATLAALRGRADDLMLGRVSYPGLFFQQDTASGRYEDLEFGHGYQGPSLNYRKIEKLELDPLFRALIELPAYEEVVRAVIPGEVVIYRAVLMSKAACGGTVLPWHQDGGRFWGLDRDPVLQIWTALDDAGPTAGCLEVLPESHRAGLATPLGGVVPADRVAAADPEPRALPLPARAGEAILLHNQAWHRSLVNQTDQPRRAVTVCYMPAETRCLRKKRSPRAFVRVFGHPEAPLHSGLIGDRADAEPGRCD